MGLHYKWLSEEEGKKLENFRPILPPLAAPNATGDYSPDYDDQISKLLKKVETNELELTYLRNLVDRHENIIRDLTKKFEKISKNWKKCVEVVFRTHETFAQNLGP